MHAESSKRWLRILTILIPILALNGCGEGDGQPSIAGKAADPLPELPAGFCDPINFEIFCESPAIINFNGGATVIVENPAKSGINPSDYVARMQKFPDEVFGGTRFNPAEVPLDFSTGEVFKIKVWSPRPVPVLFKLEETNDGTLGVSREVTHSGSGGWEELCFDFTGQTVNTIGLTIIFDNGVLGQASTLPGDWTFYYDDITQVKSCVDSGPATGTVPDVTLYYPNPASDPPDLVIPDDYTEVTPFGSESVINLSYADDDTYGEVLAVSSGTGYSANIGQIGFIGFDPGFVTFYENLIFKVKGMPNFVIFVQLYEGGNRLRVNLSSSNFSEALDNGWYQVSIPLSSFTGLTSATSIVFESDDTSPMQFTFFLTDIGFSVADGGGDGGDDHGAGTAGVFTETTTESLIAVTSITNSIDFSGNNTIADDASTAIPAFEGSVILSIDYQDSGQTYGGAVLNFGGVDLTAYDTLNFTIDTSGITGFADLTIQMEPPGAGAAGTNVQVSGYTPVATSGNWATYAIPLADFTATNFAAVDNLGFWNPRSGTGTGAPLAFGTLYVDDVYLSVAGGNGGGAEGNLAVNGGFDTGDFTGWAQYPSAQTTQTIVVDATTSSNVARLFIPASAGGVNNVLKQERLLDGEGVFSASDVIQISFDYRGEPGEGILFVKSICETAEPICGDKLHNNGGPFVPTATWTNYTDTFTLGAGVTGYTLEFAAVCGGTGTCVADYFIDNVSIVIN